MRNKNILMQFKNVIIAFVCTLVLYIGYRPRIECKPTDLSFWVILVLGISVGVAITKIIMGLRQKN